MVCRAEVILQFEADLETLAKLQGVFKGSYSPVHIPLGTNIPAQGLTELGRGFSQNRAGVFHKYNSKVSLTPLLWSIFFGMEEK